MGYKINSGLPITWTTEDFYYIDSSNVPHEDTIKLELSRNDGSTWEVIVADITNSGLYSWYVTGPTATSCYIRYSGVHNTDVTALSGLFSIDPAAANPGSLINRYMSLGGNLYLIPSSEVVIVSGNLVIGGLGLRLVEAYY